MSLGPLQTFHPGVESAGISPTRDVIDVLLIDPDASDNLDYCDVAARSRQILFVVTCCRSLAEATEALSRRRSDVIFLEYWLGDETTVAFIHDNARRSVTPCVVLTHLDEPDIRRLAFRAGARGFLAKAALAPQTLDAITLAVLRPARALDGAATAPRRL